MPCAPIQKPHTKLIFIGKCSGTLRPLNRPGRARTALPFLFFSRPHARRRQALGCVEEEGVFRVPGDALAVAAVAGAPSRGPLCHEVPLFIQTCQETAVIVCMHL